MLILCRQEDLDRPRQDRDPGSHREDCRRKGQRREAFGPHLQGFQVLPRRGCGSSPSLPQDCRKDRSPIQHHPRYHPYPPCWPIQRKACCLPEAARLWSPLGHRTFQVGCWLNPLIFRINGVPLRRVSQAYVIATSTKVDVAGVSIPESVNDSYFVKSKASKSTKEGEFFGEGKEKKAFPEEKKSEQKVRQARGANTDGRPLTLLCSPPSRRWTTCPST